MELSNAWRTQPFKYTWLRKVADHYTDSWQVIQDALVFAAKELKLIWIRNGVRD